MNIAEYNDDSSDENDSDYCPVNDSGSDSIDENDEGIEYEEQNTDEVKGSKKRKKNRKKGTIRHQKTAALNKEDEESEKDREKIGIAADPDEEKKRVDALWADFLGGGGGDDTSSEPKKDTAKKPLVAKSSKEGSKKDIPKSQQAIVKEDTEPKIFEFAGETIEVSNSQNEQSNANLAPQSNLPATDSAAASSNIQGVKRPSSSGLSSVLNQLTKKNKLSVLEKTKIDWDGFKSKEGINEELKTHNRGREGFLERRDFLERTDFRQFEIEKNMRLTTKRSNK